MEALATTQPRRRIGLIGAVATVRVRWWIFLYMFLFPLLCYVQRNGLTIATDQVKAQLHVSQFQVFLVSSAFMVLYTALQVPAGAFGQRMTVRLIHDRWNAGVRVICRHLNKRQCEEFSVAVEIVCEAYPAQEDSGGAENEGNGSEAAIHARAPSLDARAIAHEGELAASHRIHAPRTSATCVMPVQEQCS